MILGSGPEPDRPGDRVRLLLRARGDDRARVRPRRGDGQLQPGDGLDRLRHLRPPLLRAADARGRARRRRGRAARGRDRPVRRPDAAASSRPASRRRACRCSARPSRRSTSPRTAAASARCSSELGLTGAAVRDRALAPRRRSAVAPRRRLPAARAPELRARRPRDGDRLLARRARRLPAARRRAAAASARSSSTASSRTRSRSTSTRSATARTSGSAAIMQHVEEAGDPLRRLGLRAAAALARRRDARADRGRDRRHRARARRRRADQRPVRGARRRALRDRGQPARLAHGAVRLQGDRACRWPSSPAGVMLGERLADARAADRARGARPRRRSRRRCCRSTASRRRLAARPGDALHRRGDGRRRRLPGRVRQGAGGGRRAAAARPARCSSPSPTATSRPRRSIAAPLHDLGFAIVATRRHGGRRSAAWASRSSALNKIAEGSPNVVERIERGDVDLVINTPTGTGARADGYEIRARGGRARHPLHHHDDRRDGGARARSRAARSGEPDGASRCRSCTRAEPRRRDARERRAASRRSAAGALRRSSRTSRSAPTADLARSTPTGPPPRPGPVLHARRGRALGRGRRTSGPSCRAPSRCCAAHDDGAAATSCSRTSGPGTERLRELRAGRRAVAARPARHRLRARRATGGGRCSSAAASAIAPLAIWQDALGRDARRSCSASATPAHAAGAALLARRAGRDRRRLGRPPRARHRTARERARRDAAPTVYACGPPPMLEAVRALCAERGVPAQLALESGMACGFGACFGCVVPTRATATCALCVDGPVLDAAELDARSRA